MSFAGSTTGTVLWFNNEKKFGKVSSDVGEIFLPPNVTAEFADSLVKHATVQLNYHTAAQGLAASKIKSVFAPELELMEFAGKVKWYNPERGLGYIIPTGMEFELRVTAAEVETSTLPTLVAGQAITCTAKGIGDRWDIVKILDGDKLTVVPGWHVSRIVRASRKGDIGTIISPEGEEVTIHQSVAKEAGLAQIFKGVEIGYQYDLESKQGLRVTQVCHPKDVPAGDDSLAAE